jgi:hypothetical protein
MIPRIHCIALTKRIGSLRPHCQFVRLFRPEITAYQTIQIVLLLAYDLVGN